MSSTKSACISLSTATILLTGLANVEAKLIEANEAQRAAAADVRQLEEETRQTRLLVDLGLSIDDRVLVQDDDF